MSNRKTQALAAFLLLLGLASPGATGAEHKLTGPEIQALLADATVVGGSGDGAFKQYFAPTGQTTYVGTEATPSQGSWRVTGDQYCSVWPPSGTWACYDVEGDPEASPPTVTWIGESGTRYPGTVAKGNGL